MSILLKSNYFLALSRNVTRFHSSSCKLANEKLRPEKDKTLKKKAVIAKIFTELEKTRELEVQKLRAVEKRISGKFASLSSKIKSSYAVLDLKNEDKHYRTLVLKYYIKASAKTDKLNRASSLLFSLPVEEVNIEAYECALKYLAIKGEFLIVQKFWTKLIQSKVKPSIACYAAAFQCLANCSEKICTSVAEDLFEELVQNHGPDGPNQIFGKILPRSQSDYEQMLSGIRLARPDFEPVVSNYHLAKEFYSNNALLKEFSNLNIEKLTPQMDHLSLQECKLLLEHQLQLEKDGVIEIQSVANNVDQTPEEVEAVNKCLDSLKVTWREQLKTSLAKRIAFNKMLSSKKPKSISLYPFLESLPIEEIVDYLLEEIEMMMSLSDGFSPSTRMFQGVLGTKLMEKLQMSDLLEDPDKMNKYVDVISEYLKWFLNPSDKEFDAWCPREAFDKADAKSANQGPLYEFEVLKWPPNVKQMLGRELLKAIMTLSLNIGSDGSIIIDDKMSITQNSFGDLRIKPTSSKVHMIPASSPALYGVLRTRPNKVTLEIKPHPILSKLFERKKLSSMKFSSSFVPMLVPPLPWSSQSRGGFYLRPSDFCRFPESPSLLELENIGKKWDGAYAVFDSLNQLGCTPWIINDKVLDVALTVFQNQKQYSELLDSLGISHPDLLKAPEKTAEMLPFMNNEDYKAHARAVIEYNKARAEAYSLWCDTLYKLSIANHFR